MGNSASSAKEVPPATTTNTAVPNGKANKEATKVLSTKDQQSRHVIDDDDAANDDVQFQRLDASQRAVTFDERAHGKKQQKQPDSPDVDHQFKPLLRASTFDARFRRKKASSQSVQDILYRRYFNAQPIRREIMPSTTKSTEEGEQKQPSKGIVVIVDPLSTGICMARAVLERGYKCVCVYSDTLEVMAKLIAHVPQDLTNAFDAIIYHDGSRGESLSDTVSSIQNVVQEQELQAVLSGAETGVPLADALSEALETRTNGTIGSDARRNKYAMGEAIRNAGLRAVKQCAATTWTQVNEFVTSELMPTFEALNQPFEVIVKPVESAGSDDVTLCRSLEEVRTAFGNIQGKINGLGLENKATLVQEYLNGIEYVVDTVSRDGEHKVVAVWQYDKRATNNSDFVYYGLLLKAVDSDLLRSIVSYVLSVCDTLGIVNGPGHAEVKVIDNGRTPCLVEIGARCHGGEGTYMCIVDDCIGYNQVDVTLDSYLSPDAFKSVPDMPKSLKRYGAEVMLVSYEDGVFKNFAGLESVKAMPSYLKDLLYLKEGDKISKTIDMFTTPGSFMLLHESEDTMLSDYNMIHDMAKPSGGLYELASKDTTFNDNTLVHSRKTVVVVDPFSTGAVLAAHLKSRGVETICVYSDTLDKIDHVASLVPKGLEVSFAATVEYDGSDLQKLLETLKSIATKQSLDIFAVLPGAETGVLLADAIVNAWQMSFANDFTHSAARRDKYKMGETLRNAGLRAVKQCSATSVEEAIAFVKAMDGAEMKVVLKPLESAGTDDVILCESLSEVTSAFNLIYGKKNELGITNSAVLCQEYLDGTEYVLDTVSKDGQHKVIAVWQYDKRRVNDAAFVYFGVRAVDASSDVIKSLIAYHLKVLDALGVRNGPAHGELKFSSGSPVLIEVGARVHGGEGAWIAIADRCVGYNQVDATLDALLSSEKFKALPSAPLTLLEHGCEAMLVNYSTGVLKSIPGLMEIERFPSFLSKEVYTNVGERIVPTIDMFTTPGSVMLVHKDATVLEANLERIRQLELSGMYDVIES